MAERYVKEGPNKRSYGLSVGRNKDVDSHKQYLAHSQNKVTKRSKLDSQVSMEGGKVYWGRDEQEKDTVLPYTKGEHESLRLREERVASRMKELKEKYNLGNITLGLTDARGMDDYLAGKVGSEVKYTAGGQLVVEKLKDGERGKVYTLMEANSFLRNLERYADRVEKIESFKRRHGNKSKLEATASGVVALLGIGFGILSISSNITGNVVAGSSTSSESIIGAVLLVVGIIGAFFYFRKKR